MKNFTPFTNFIAFALVNFSLFTLDKRNGLYFCVNSNSIQRIGNMNANNFVSSSSFSREKMVETCLWLLNMFLWNFYLQVAWTLHHPREIRPPFRQHSRHCPRNYLPGCKLHILKNSVDAFAGYFGKTS